VAVTTRAEGSVRTRSVNQCSCIKSLTGHVLSPTCFGHFASCNKLRLLQKRLSCVMVSGAWLPVLLQIPVLFGVS
jgi:hypothetical protein